MVFAKDAPSCFTAPAERTKVCVGGGASTGPPDAGQGPHARWLRFRLVHVRLLGLFKNYSMPCKKKEWSTL